MRRHDVERLAREAGFDLVGVCRPDPPEGATFVEDWVKRGYHAGMEYMERHADLRRDPDTLLPDVQSIIAVGLNYHQPVDHAKGEPKIAEYALGRDYHKILRGKLKRLADSFGLDHEWRACVDSAPILEREYAQRAGLGWPGKHTCLINSQHGSWFVIGLLLTTLDIPPSRPAKGGCGTCDACIRACPTGAIVHEEDRWQVDSRRCISYLTIEHKGEIDPDLEALIGDHTFGCDVCQTICPFNRPRPRQPDRAQTTTEPGFLATRELPSLVELTQLDEPTWDRATRGSAVRRAGLEGLKRNARINLANQGPSE